MAIPTRRAAPTVLLGVASLVLVSLIVYRVYLGSSYFPDDRYNLGVAVRSALTESRHFLETSAVFLFFEPYPIPRAEDCHRGLSVVLLKYWVRLTGATDGPLARTPHLIWVALWLLVCLWLLRRLDGQPGAPLRLLGPAWECLLLIGLLVVSPWGFTLLCRAYLDDVPSAVFVLTAILVISTDPQNAGRAAIGGVLLGGAYAAKDFAAIWLPILLCSFVLHSVRHRSTILRPLVGFIVGYGLACLPRIAWDLHDFGTILANPLRHGLRVLYFSPNGFPIDFFDFFFLRGDDSYRSVIALSGGIGGACKHILARSVPCTLKAMALLSFAWIWLIPHFLRVRRSLADRGPLRFLNTVTCTAAVAYAVFFSLAQGEATQLRYWIVPVSLSLILGVSALCAVASRNAPGGWTWRALFIFLGPACVLQANPYAGDTREYAQPWVTPDQAQALSSRAERGFATMMPLFQGFHYWSMHPENNVVIVCMPCVAKLDEDQLRTLVNLYSINRIVFPPDDVMLSRFKRIGFLPRRRWGDSFVLFERAKQMQGQ